MYEIRIHEEADDEFLAAIAYYESHADLGEEFLVEVTKGLADSRAKLPSIFYPSFPLRIDLRC